jgi:hypothetical protein
MEVTEEPYVIDLYSKAYGLGTYKGYFAMPQIKIST